MCCGSFPSFLISEKISHKGIVNAVIVSFLWYRFLLLFAVINYLLSLSFLCYVLFIAKVKAIFCAVSDE